jgi:hypothetical protein
VGTEAPELLVSVKPMELACTASLNVAVTGDETAMPVLVDAGVWLVTAGLVPPELFLSVTVTGTVA